MGAQTKDCTAALRRTRIASQNSSQDGEMHYTDMAPTQEMVDILDTRRDDQVMAWELMSIALGVPTFGQTPWQACADLVRQHRRRERISRMCGTCERSQPNDLIEDIITINSLNNQFKFH